MDKVGIFYGSSTGNTRDVSQKLCEAFGPGKAELHNIAETTPESLRAYRNLVFAGSTWGTGELQDDWERFFPQLDEVDLHGKCVALMALGDQQNYPETFASWMGFVFDKVIERGATVVGDTELKNYAFTASASERGGRFLGLVIDEDNQADLTPKRISDWVRRLKREFY